MRVGLDLLYLTPGQTGGRESYARELVPALLERAPELELVAFVNRDAGAQLAAELGDAVKAVVLPVSERSRIQWATGELALVSVAAARQRVELVHSLANFAPAWGPFRRIVTIHDLQYKALPELLSWPMRTGTSALISLAAHRARRIIAVSAAGRDEIVAGLGVEPERIDVVPNGVRTAARAPGPSAIADLREGLQLGTRQVVLAVASNLAHKNLPALLHALALIEAPERPALVIAGHASDDGNLAQHAELLGIAPDVRLLGHCSTEDLESLYALAACLALPTLHEGFGLPVLEAMARSLPVLCSDLPALREVAADAALFFDPRIPEQIAEKIREVLTHERLAQELRGRGLVQAAKFSWTAAAEGTLACYRSAVAGSGPAL
jgi:glycosyltransferase involved in cell wall biosynthesis